MRYIQLLRVSENRHEFVFPSTSTSIRIISDFDAWGARLVLMSPLLALLECCGWKRTPRKPGIAPAVRALIWLPFACNRIAFCVLSFVSQPDVFFDRPMFLRLRAKRANCNPLGRLHTGARRRLSSGAFCRRALKELAQSWRRASSTKLRLEEELQESGKLGHTVIRLCSSVQVNLKFRTRDWTGRNNLNLTFKSSGSIQLT